MATKTSKRKKLPRTGDCYRKSGMKIMEFPAGTPGEVATLVHGVAIGTGRHNRGKPFGHAWIETVDGALVYDADHDKVFPAVVFYSVGQIDPAQCQRYTRDEAVTMMLEHEHYGPWVELPDNVL